MSKSMLIAAGGLTLTLAMFPFPGKAGASDITVRCGDIVEGEFEHNDERHNFYINMNPGDVLYFVAVPVGDFLRFYARVHDPSGNEILFTDSSHMGARRAVQKLKGTTGTLSARGIYEIRLFNAYTGIYSFHIGCILRDGTEIAPGQPRRSPRPPPPVPPQPAPTPRNGNDPQMEALLRQIAVLQAQIASMQGDQPSPPARPVPTQPAASPQTAQRGVTLYEHQDFGGRDEFFSQDDPSLKDNLIGRNSATSIRVTPGCRTTLYKSESYQGKYIVVHKDVATLDGTEVGNDKVSSLKVACD